MNDDPVRRSLRLERPMGVAEQEQYIAQLHRGCDDFVQGIVRRDDERLLGLAGLHGIRGPGRQGQLGIFIGDPAERGRGFGTEATRLLVGFGFGPLDLARIWLHVDPDNQPAVRVYRKLGFRPQPGPRLLAGPVAGRGEVLAMSLLRREWAPAPVASPPR